MGRIARNTWNWFKTGAINIYLDYRRVFLEDIVSSVRENPKRSTLYGGCFSCIIYGIYANEDLKSYTADIITACNRLGAVVEHSRNPNSDKFVQCVGELNCHKLLRQINLGFMTLIWQADHNPEVALFRCTYFRPSILEIVQNRMVDLGILGHWLALESKMKDYDINEDEYSSQYKT